MSRIGFGADNMMRAILELSGVGNCIEWPVESIRHALVKKGTPLNPMSIRGYLDDLRGTGHVSFVMGGPRGGQIRTLTILKRDVPAPAVQREPEIPKPVAVAQPAVPEAKKINIILMVDYDNAACAARSAGLNLSFGQLKQYVRGFGDRLLFADAFVSPASNTPEIAAKLWESGFQVIACPMAVKEKDAVDSKINWRARQYITATDVTKLVIVSNDRDFKDLSDFVKDFDKTRQVMFLDVLAERQHLEGYDLVNLESGKRLGSFESAIQYLAAGTTGITREEGERVNFIKHAIREILNREYSGAARTTGFHELKSYVWGRVSPQWGKVFSEIDLQNALTAMNNQKVLVKNTGLQFFYYMLNQAHPAVRKSFHTTFVRPVQTH